MNTEMPAMKPVLVTGISDDIRTLREDEVEQQKKLLTARAIMDAFKCDAINVTERDVTKNRDAAFCEEHEVPVSGETMETYWMCNLDKVFYGSRRALGVLPDNTDQIMYFNGPESVQDPAFLEIYSILPGDKLTWADYGGKYPIDESGNKVPDAQPLSKYVRQVLYPSGVYPYKDIHGKWTYRLDNTTVYTRVGVLNEDTKNSYIWASWEAMSGECLHVVIDEDTVVAGRSVFDPAATFIPSINTIYEVHTNITNFALPDPNNYKLGQKIEIYQYPMSEADSISPELSATNVSYTEEYEDSALGRPVSNPMFLTCVPAVQRNTGHKADVALFDKLSPARYAFEIVEVFDSDNRQAGHTWELEVSNEETDYTAGMAELLDEHVELVEDDLIVYKLRKYDDEDPLKHLQSSTADLIINRVVSSAGVAKCTVNVLDHHFAHMAEGWKMTVNVADANSGAKFKILTEAECDAGPIPGQIYYIQNGLSFLLASSTGHLTAFESEYVLTTDKVFVVGTVYYTRTGTGVPEDPFVYEVADIPYGHAIEDANKYFVFKYKDYFTLELTSATFEPVAIFDAATLKYGMNYAFRRIARNSILQIIIHPGSTNHKAVRDGNAGMSWAVPVVGFYPDPHGAYLMKTAVSEDAYTEKMVAEQQASGKLPSSSGETSKDLLASVKTITEVYRKIVGEFQRKGLFFGTRCDTIGIRHNNYYLNQFLDDGNYWISPKMVAGSEDEVIDASTYFTDVNKRWFVLNEDKSEWIELTFKSSTIWLACEKAGIPPVEKMSDLYVGVAVSPGGAWPAGCTADDARLIVMTNKRAGNALLREEEATDEDGYRLLRATEVTQMFIQQGTQFHVWFRSGKLVYVEGKDTPSGVNWTDWIPLHFAAFDVDMTDRNSVSAAMIAAEMTKGEPHIKVGHSTIKTIPTNVDVALPDPRNYDKGSRLVLLLCGGKNTIIKVHYTVGSNTYEADDVELTNEMALDGDVYQQEWTTDGHLWYLTTIG